MFSVHLMFLYACICMLHSRVYMYHLVHTETEDMSQIDVLYYIYMAQFPTEKPMYSIEVTPSLYSNYHMGGRRIISQVPCPLSWTQLQLRAPSLQFPAPTDEVTRQKGRRYSSAVLQHRVSPPDFTVFFVEPF